jgi:hypothetical protein
VRIPKRFKLHGHTLEVKVVSGSDMADHGMYEPDKELITVRKSTPAMQEHSWLHELTHAILLAMGKDKLYADEGFVDSFSALLHQALTSAEYK